MAHWCTFRVLASQFLSLPWQACLTLISLHTISDLHCKKQTRDRGCAACFLVLARLDKSRQSQTLDVGCLKKKVKLLGRLDIFGTRILSADHIHTNTVARIHWSRPATMTRIWYTGHATHNRHNSGMQFAMATSCCMPVAVGLAQAKKRGRT